MHLTICSSSQALEICGILGEAPGESTKGRFTRARQAFPLAAPSAQECSISDAGLLSGDGPSPSGFIWKVEDSTTTHRFWKSTPHHNPNMPSTQDYPFPTHTLACVHPWE